MGGGWSLRGVHSKKKTCLPKQIKKKPPERWLNKASTIASQCTGSSCNGLQLAVFFRNFVSYNFLVVSCHQLATSGFLISLPGGCFYWDGTYTFLGWTPLPPPPPQTPFQCPHPNKKGTNLLLFQISIHLHNHQDIKLRCCRVMGQKLRCGRP